MAARSPRSRTGFTLVELLVVVAIVALLIGVLVPALGAARQRADQTRDAGALRQTLTANQIFSTDRDDGLIVAKYAQNEVPPGVTVSDGFGGIVRGVPAERYTWRLLSYLDAGPRGTLLTGEREAFLDAVPADPDKRFNWHYLVSVYPSFGINGHFLGGYNMRAGGESHVGGDPPFRVAKRRDQVPRPSDMVHFASARGEAFDGGALTQWDGWYLVEAPAWLTLGPMGGGAPRRWSDEPYSPDSSPFDYGGIHARYDGSVLTGMADGHVAMRSPEELRDMQHWSADAQRDGDPDWSPAGGG